MHVVAITETGAGPTDVQAVDVWFSTRRGAWMVERLDADGRQVGPAHCCASEADAEDCLEVWLRAHAEVRLVERGDTSGAARRIVRRAARRAA